MRYPRMNRQVALLAVGLAASAVLIACGGGDNDGGSPTAEPSTGRPAATRPAASPTSPAAQLSPVATPTVVAIATASAPPAENTPVPPPPAQNTTVPPPPPPPTNTPVPPPAGNVSVYIKAVTTAFSPSTATVPAGATVSLTFDNQDAGVMHDFVLYGTGSSILAATDIATGPNTQTITFTVTAGQYAFKCSVHPREMNGALTVQ